ncbi:MAG: AI-2E family transporter [Alphaproteobacteria bacterium]|nr:AI-2E family transporter [Alphaproteobacteria bacterium]NCQ67572.1 AI-2E family transporter [Alphaproteobacteria bacterium]NCT08344.1 AI-2E family transporter [Alphaproteobacteria bacterium]
MSKNGSKTHLKTSSPKQKASNTKTVSAVRPADDIRKKVRLRLLGGGALLAVFFYYLYPVMMPFGVALIFAYALDPAVSFFERKGLGRTAATSVMVLSIMMLIVTLLFFTIPFLKKELHSLAVTLPDYLKTFIESATPKIQTWISSFQGNIQEEIQKTVTENLSKMLKWVFTFLAGLFTNTLALANLVSLVLLTPLLIFYLLRDWPKILNYIHGLVPHTMKPSSLKLGDEINATLSGYFRGQASVCVILAFYYTLALSLMGLEFAFTVGLLSGLLAFIPYVGFFIGFVAAVGITLAQFSGFDYLFIVLAIYGTGQVVESFYLTPKLIGGRIGLHPVWVIFSLLAGGFLMGFTGLLLAVPLSATLAVLLRFAMNDYRQRLEAYEA